MPDHAPVNGSKAGRTTVAGELQEFVESGVAVIIGSADAAGRPHVLSGWGPRVSEDGSRLSVFVEVPRAGQLLANATANGRIAVTVADPVSYRSMQLKGHCVETQPATAEEAAWVARHQAAFLTTTSLVGDPPDVIQKMSMEGPLRRFDISIEQLFDQTPGPNAGMPL